MKVGGVGHFGELLNVEYVEIQKTIGEHYIHGERVTEWVNISIQWAGNDPG